MKKKIWIVTELFYPEETAVAFIFSRIANHLSTTYKIGVICGPEFYDENKKEFRDDIQISDEIEIFRTKAPNLDKNSLLQRSVKIILLSLRLAWLMCKKVQRNETVILATNPALLLLIVRGIRFFKKFKLHILVHDVFPENALSAGIIKSDKTIVFRILKYLFDRAYSSADQLIVLGSDMKEVLFSKVKRFRKQPLISIVTNWANPDKIVVKERIPDKGSRLVLQYAGNIGRVQGIAEILEAFSHSKNGNLDFCIRGTGSLYQYINTFISKNNLQNVFLRGGFSRTEEPDILAGCDIGLVSLSNGMYGLGVPSKAYHLLSAGKPILYIGEPHTEISNLIKDEGIGWSLDIRNQKEIIDFFNNLNLIKASEILEMGRKARVLAETRYSEAEILSLLRLTIDAI